MAGVYVKSGVCGVSVAGFAQREYDMFAHRKIFHLRAALYNFTHAFVAQNKRVFKYDVHMSVLNHLHVGAVAKAAGPDPDERFIFRKLRVGNVAPDFKLIGCSYNNSFHGI